MKKLKSRNTWQGCIVDAGDGSGDGILELPDELMEQLGWKIGDTLALAVNTENELVVRKL